MNAQPKSSSRRHLKEFLLLAVIWLLVLVAISPIGRFYAKHAKSVITNQARRQEVYETVIRPSAEWVRVFRLREGRLPTKEEVETFAKSRPEFGNRWVGIYDTQPVWVQRQWRPGVDFMICAHVADWNLFYNSWDGKERKQWTD